MDQQKRVSSEDTGECSSSSQEAVKSEMDSKQEQNVIKVGISKNIHFDETLITQSSLYGTGNLSNPFEELFSVWKERLMKHYQTDNAYMKWLFWKYEKNDFPMKEYFVDLKVQKSELLGFKTGEYVQLKQIFQKDISHHRVILVTGDPGYGKTTLCKKIAYDWGEDDKNNDYLSHFDFVVFIPLRESKERNVYNEILNKISNNVDDSYSAIKRELINAKLNFLVILDGFDDSFDKSSVIDFIRNDSVIISKNMTILVTSRPRVAEEIREYVTDRFFLEGFSPEQQKKYIELVIKDDMDMKNLLLHSVSKDYGQLGKCPLMLHMLCCLPDTKYLKKIKTRTDLYVQIFRLIIKRHREKKDSKHDLKKGKIFYGENLLFRLGELIYEEVCSPNLCDIFNTFITSEELKRKFPIQQEYEFIVNLDILSKCFEINNVVYFDTPHKTFTEFLLNLYLYDCFISIPCFQTDTFSPFVFGLFTNEVFPENFLKSIKQFFFPPLLWWASYKEIKDQDNQELFRLNSKLLIPYGTLNDWKEMIQHFHFTQIYYFFPEPTHFYEPVRNELIQFHNNYNGSNELEIFLILDLFIFDRNAYTGFRDMRDIGATIKNLLNSYCWKKFKIYLFGISPFRTGKLSDVHKKYIHVFNKIENPAIISEEIKEFMIKSNEPIVSLHSIHKSFTISYFDDEQGLVIENKVETINITQNLISAEVFKNLKSYIKLAVEDQQV